MNRVREELSTGISADDADRFRKRVSQAITDTERICAEHRCSPSDLPLPSYQAYQFLKSIDLEHLPIQPANQVRVNHTARVGNLVAITDSLQSQFADMAGPNRSSPAVDDSGIAAVAARIQSLVAQTEEICRNQDSHPAHLPAESRRAYEWLKFLSTEQNLLLHLKTLRTGYERLDARLKSAPRAHVRFDLYNCRGLYRTKQTGDSVRVLASEGYVGAPEAVMDALAGVAVSRRKASFARVLKEYERSEEFAEVMALLELPTTAVETNTRGQCFDLGEVFDRVNAAYFASRVPRPKLVWNKTLTCRKMGHYQLSTDTIMLSITLDHPSVPAYAIELVMYHEMLHKVMGDQVMNGRFYAHTPAFKRAERRFAHYERAKKFIDALSGAVQNGNEGDEP